MLITHNNMFDLDIQTFGFIIYNYIYYEIWIFQNLNLSNDYLKFSLQVNNYYNININNSFKRKCIVKSFF